MLQLKRRYGVTVNRLAMKSRSLRALLALWRSTMQQTIEDACFPSLSSALGGGEEHDARILCFNFLVELHGSVDG